MDMYEASDDVFDTLSFSDVQIYSDPSSSLEEEQDLGDSFSSFRFKLFIRSPPPKEIVFFRKLISVPKNDLKSHLNRQTPSNDNGLGRKGSTLAPVVRPPRRRGKGFLMMFGSTRPSVTMELGDLRSRQARGTPQTLQEKRFFAVYDGGEELEEMMPRRRSGNSWSRKFFGACIPSFG